MLLSPSTTTGRIRIALLGLLALHVLLLFCLPSFSAAQDRAAAFLANGGSAANMPWELDVDRGLTLAASINAALLVGLFFSAHWWARPFRSLASSTPARRLPHSLLLGLLVMSSLGIALRLPLAGKSLWWDELWSIRQCSHGQWKPDPKSAEPDTLKFTPTSWKRCAFYYQKPTNHVPMSLLQKLSLNSWRTLSGAPREAFDDLAARWPALTGSFITILLAGCLLHCWGATAGASLAAAFLLAIHPMAIRYGVDARAYALAMPLSIAALIAATGIVRSAGRSLSSLACFTLITCLWLWAFPHNLTDVIVLSSLIAVLLWRANPSAADRLTALLRLGIALLGAAMLLLQLFLPCFLQARRWLDSAAHDHLLTGPALVDALAQIFTGLPWHEHGIDSPLGEGLTDLQHVWGSPLIGQAVLLLLTIGIATALVAHARASKTPSFLLLSPFVSAALFGLALIATHNYFYTRFWIVLLPAAMIALGSLMDRRHPRRIWLGWIVVLAATLTSQRGTALLQVRPIEPVHETVRWIDTQPDSPRVIAYGHGFEALLVYLPTAHPVTTAAEIESELAAAQSAGEPPPLLVVSHINFNRALISTGFPLFEDPTRFHEVARFGGLTADAQHRVYRALHPPPQS